MLPLSLPGVFAGSLLTFIPASGDFINAELLGSPQPVDDRHRHPDQFLVQATTPVAAVALSFVLMAIILIAVLVYAAVLGTEDLA